MAFDIGSFFATLGLDTGEYTKGLLNAQSLNAAFGQSFTNFIANPIAGGIALIKNFAGAFVKASVDTLSYAETLGRLSKETGVSTTLLQALEQSLKAAGAAADAGLQGLAFFANQLGTARAAGGPAKDAIDAIGLSLDRLGNNDQAVRSVLEALAAIEDPARRAQLATDLFGRQAGPVLAANVAAAGGSINDLIEDFRSLGLIIETNSVTKLGKLEDALGRVQQNIDGIKTQALVGFLEGFLGDSEISTGAIDDLGETIRAKLVPAMKDFGEQVRVAADNMEKLLKVTGFMSDYLRGFDNQGDYFAQKQLEDIKRTGAKTYDGPPMRGLRDQFGAPAR